MKRLLCLLLCALLLPTLSACAQAAEGGLTTGEAVSDADAAAQTATDLSALLKPKDTNESWDGTATAVTLDGAAVAVDGEGAVWDATAATLTFTAAGDYVLAGTLAGSLVVTVSKDEDVRLILNDASVSSPVGPALYVTSADKVILTLAPGTQNAFADAAPLELDGDTISSCVYSKDDLTVNGAGALSVAGNVKNGVVCKNDLLLVNGQLSVTAKGNGIRGKDSVVLAGGEVTVASDGDGVVSDADDEKDTGSVLVAGGTLTVTAGGGADNATARERYWGREAAQTDSGVSMKAVKAAGALNVTGGTLRLDSADDALHAHTIGISGGALSIRTGDDGAHADDALTVSGGTIVVSQSYEGLEALTLTVSGGEIDVTASDDGLNAAGGNDSSAMQGFGGFDRFGADAGASIVLSGGVLHVNAEGDGVDSNGSITISGGETYVDGPTAPGNGALDYGTECVVTGGVLVAVDAGGMSQNVSESSTQAAVMCSANGGEIVVTGADGSTLLTYAPAKSYSVAVISCPGLRVGESCTVTCGGTQAYAGTLAQTVTGGSGFGGFGGFGGGRGNGGGGRKNSGQPPEDMPQGGFGDDWNGGRP